jgi:hypothetical protein
MAPPKPDPVLSQIRVAIEVTACNPAPSLKLIEEVERRLGVPFPEWVRGVYRSCNGFCGPTGVRYLYPLDGRDGVLELTLFLRNEDWSPPWLKRAIVFGDNGVGGSITTHWLALDGKLIQWCYGDGTDFSILNCDLFALWSREQALWDAVRVRG